MAVVTGNYTPTSEVVIHRVDVDIINRQMISEPIHLVQYDDRLPVLEVKLWKDNEEYVIISNVAVNIRFEKPDKKYVYNNVLGISTDRKKVYVEILFAACNTVAGQ